MALDLSKLPDKAIDFSKLPNKALDFSKLPDKQDTGLWDRFVKATGAESDMMSSPANAEILRNVVGGGSAWIPAGVIKAAGIVSGQREGADELANLVQEKITGTPSTEVGKLAQKQIATPFEILSEKSQQAGDWVYDKTGSPLLATATRVAGEAIPFVAPVVVAKGLKGIKGAVKAPEIDLGKVSEKPYSITPDVSAELKASVPKEVAPEIKAEAQKVEPSTEMPKAKEFTDNDLIPNMKADLDNAGKGGLVHNEDGTTTRLGAGIQWLTEANKTKDVKVDVSGAKTILDKVANGKPLTFTQQKAYDAIIKAYRNNGGNSFEERVMLAQEGFQPIVGKKVEADNLTHGDEILVQGEKFKVTDIDENGNVTLKDGTSIKVKQGAVLDDVDYLKENRSATEFNPESLETVSKAEPIKPTTPIETPIEGKPAKAAVDVNNEATGIKNESVDASRQRRNIEELERHGVTNADQEVSFNRAKQLVDSGERNPRELADKITQNKDYQVSELDSFVLQYERAKLENAHKNIYKQIEEAQKKGDTEAELKLIEEREKIETDLDLNDRASGVAGTQWSNIGKARQRMIEEDYSLSAIIRKARADKGGEALTPEERIKYENFAKEIAEANEKIKTLEEANAKLESEKTVKQIQNKIRYETRQAKRTYTKEQLKTESDTLVKELNDVLGGLHANPFADPKAVKILGRLAENKVRSGYLTVEGVIDSIYTDLKNTGIEVSKRDIRDAISGYGKTTHLSKEEITAKLRELRHEMRLVSALEDAQNKQVPLKSGLQRDLPTDQIRELQRKVKQTMREQGIDNLKTPEERWKSSLDAVKTRLKHQITDLAKRLETGEIEPKKIGIKYDEQAMDLVRVRNKVQDVLNFAEGVKGKELSPEQKIRNAKASVERSIGEYERRLRENDLSPKKKVSTTPNTKELQKLRNERDLLKDLYKTLQEEAKPKLSPEEIALKSYKTRTANRITELEQKIKNNDFATKKKNETKLDGEALKLYHELDRVKYRYQEARMKDLWKRKNVLEKGYEGVKETANLMRSLKASMDVSAVFRQGLFFSVSHPVLSAKSVPAMLKAFANDKYRFQTEQQIINNPKYKLAKDSGLELTDIGNNLSHMEETFMSRLANKIPGVAGSQRAYTTFLNKTRMDVFDSLTSKLSKEEGKILPEESKAIATLVNEATGRGSLGKANQWTGLNSLFFAPRLVASRFQLLAGHSLWKGTGASRKLIAKEYGRFLGGVATLYALSEMAGFNIEYDPRSSDFGKIKIGNTRIDPLAGLSQALVFASRIGTQETKDAQTEIVSSLREPPTPLSPDITDTIKNFGRSKLAPMPGTIVNYLAGRNVAGEKIGIKEIPRETVIPMPWVDTYEAMVEQGIPSGLALGTLAMLGVGIQTYDKNATWENKPTQASEALRKRVGEKRFKEIQSIYSEMLNKKIENIVATNRYQNLSNEEKRKKIEEIRRTTKERYLGK